MNVNNFTSRYNSGEKLIFDLRTNSGIPVANGNISISVYYKNNDSWVGNYSCLSGEGWTVNLPAVYYYAIYDTEYAEFKPIHRTITILAPEYTFWALNHTINANDNSVINLSNDYYFDSKYDSEFVNGVVINRPVTINANDHTIDALQKARIFNVTATSINITGLTFKNGKSDYGGAIYFENHISNSNINASFINNIATGEGGANYFKSSVSDSTITGTYTNNTAKESSGGANNFNSVSSSTITGTYTNNTATFGGANYFTTVSNSTINGTYTNNTAGQIGGANYFYGYVSDSTINGTYTNNKATKYSGGANYFNSGVSDSTINGTYTNNTATTGGGANRINIVSNSNITGTYTNNTATTGGGANHFWRSVSNSNIGGTYINNTAAESIIYFQDIFDERLDAQVNNAIFLNNNCTHEIYARTPGVVVKDSWFGNNASNYMNKPNVNENVQIDNWLFLNATADYNSLLIMDSSNITFKLNSTNGTDVFVFDNSKMHPVNLTLTATNGDVEKTTTLDNNVKYKATGSGKGSVTAKIENASYTIYFDNILRNVNLSVSAKNITYLENEILTLTYNNTATGKVNITLKSKNYLKTIEMDINQTVTITNLPAGEYDVTVEYSGDNIFSNATAYANFTVKKITTEVIPDNETIDLFVDEESKVTYTLKPENALGNISFSSDDTNIVSVDSVSGDIIAKGEGSANITVSFSGNENYTASKATVTVTVKLKDASVSVNNNTLDLLIGDTFTIVAITTPEGLNVSFVPDDSGVYSVDENGNVIALREGEGSILIKVGDDGIYAKNSTIVNVTVSKIPTEITVLNDTMVLAVSDEIATGATLTPSDAGNLTYSISNSSVVKVEDGKIIALNEGNATITVSFEGDKKYLTAENKTINVTVNKIPTEITVNPTSLDLFVGDETVIDATLTPGDAGNVSFTSSDDSIVIVDNKGNVIANGKGQSIITISFDGDNKYAAAENKTVTVDVSLNDASVTVDNNTLDLKVDETYQINATKHPDTILLDITYKSSNNTIATVDEKGIVTALGEGTAIITVEVGDGEIYAENSTNITVTVSKVPTEITVLNDTIVLEVNDEVSAGATLTPDDAGNLTYTSSNSSVAKVEDGKIIALTEGTATITVSFAGDKKYAAAENKTIGVNVKLKDAIISVEPDSLELIIGEDGSIYVTTDPEDLDYIFTSSDESVVTVENKNRVGKVLAVGEGNATITVTINEEAYVKNSTTVNITVNRNDTLTVTAENLTKYYKDSEKFTVTVTDARGQTVSNKTVEITINGVTYTRTTDENGTAKLNINLNSGEYPVTVAVDDIIVNSTVTVKSTIDASDVVKIFRNDTQYNARFIDSNGNILTNTNVSFNINGIIYNRTTDGNGTAKLNINLDAGDYIITATNPVTGEMSSNTIKVISLIESDDLTKYYRNASQFIVRIHSDDGNYVGAGEEVKFNINGVFYTRTTNATGHAKLNINLGQGNYTITTYYKDCIQGNNIEVLPILTAEDLVMKYMDGSQFKAKLVDGQGKAYADQSVTFNINGMLYNRVTGSDGIAKLNINLITGQYIITSSYNDFNTANKITIRG